MHCKLLAFVDTAYSCSDIRRETCSIIIELKEVIKLHFVCIVVDKQLAKVLNHLVKWHENEAIVRVVNLRNLSLHDSDFRISVIVVRFSTPVAIFAMRVAKHYDFGFV